MRDLAPVEYLPPELALDEYNPETHEFNSKTRRYKNLIVLQQAKCRPHHVQVAKQHMMGRRNFEIASALKLHASTVGSVIKRPEVQTLIGMLRMYNGHMNGPTLEHKKNILWQILIDNQTVDPKVSLAAMDQMNKMDGVYKQEMSTEIRIIIDDGTFKPTTLDQ